MDGILLIDKPKEWTSFDVVAKVRGVLRQAQKARGTRISHLDAAQGVQEKRMNRTNGTVNERQTPDDAVMRQEPVNAASFAERHGQAVRIRVGHTGTLDPLATGLLVLTLGSYCKRAQEFSKLDKVYEVEATLGQTSTTGDEEGAKSAVSDKKPTQGQIEAVLSRFTGTISQVPPAYSAIKINGQRAYKLAREGKEVVIEPREVTIHSITEVDYAYPILKFTTHVSSGTYIRSLAEDIGKELGTGVYMSNLRRTKVGNFDLKNSGTPDKFTTAIVQVDNG